MSTALKKHMAARAAAAATGGDPPMPSWARRWESAVKRTPEDLADLQVAHAAAHAGGGNESDAAEVAAAEAVAAEAAAETAAVEVAAAEVANVSDGDNGAGAPLDLLDANAKTVVAAVAAGDRDGYLKALLAAETADGAKNRKTVKAALIDRIATLDAST